MRGNKGRERTQENEEGLFLFSTVTVIQTVTGTKAVGASIYAVVGVGRRKKTGEAPGPPRWRGVRNSNDGPGVFMG